MATTSLKGVINSDFVQTIDKLGTSSGSTPGKAVADRLSGQSQKTSLDASLRTGARNFALGVQALNRGIAFVNVSLDVHEKLGGIVERLATLADKAAKGRVGGQEASSMVVEFRELAREFEKTTEGSELEGTDLLDPDGLGSALIASGLDPERSSALQQAFRHLRALNHSETDSDGNTTTSSVLIPTEQFVRSVRQTAGDFEEAAGEAEPASASFIKVRQALSSIKGRIDSNIEALKETQNIVIDNMELVRAAGRAFLDLSQQVKGSEEAEDVARSIREKVRRDVPQALEHAGNLEAIVVAGLTMSAKALAKK